MPVINRAQTGVPTAILWPDASLLSQSLLSLSIQTVCADSNRSLKNYEYRKIKALGYLSVGFQYIGSQWRLIFHDISDY